MALQVVPASHVAYAFAFAGGAGDVHTIPSSLGLVNPRSFAQPPRWGDLEQWSATAKVSKLTLLKQSC